MCGIVGCIGKDEAQSYLISGLRRLEYRGYDSAGIVTVSSGNLAALVRAKGKVIELESKANKEASNNTVGIGHTR